jgi:two-component system cell cycle response regulator
MTETSHPYRVLLIGEDPKQTEMYSELLTDVVSCNVDIISRLEVTLDWMTQSNYHLAVIDTSIKDGVTAGSSNSGLSLLEQIKRISPTTSVILVSEQAEVAEAVAAIRLGAEDYLKKPFSVEAFKLAVKRSLDRKAVFGVDNQAAKFISLLNTCQMISASLEQKKIFAIVQSYLSQELKCQHSAIYSLQAKDPIRIDSGEREDRAMQEVLDISLHSAGALVQMIQGGEMLRFIARGQLTPSLFIFRFQCAGQADYFCVCLSPEEPMPLEAFESRLRMLKAQIEVTGKNIEQYMGVQHLVYVDDATGLYNTRYLNNVLDREIQTAQTSSKSFAILFIDADRFKSINDKHGHLVGTRILYELGDQLKRFTRDSDTVFRYGGDEFVAVLSSCDLATAKSVAERIRASVEQQIFLHSDGLNIRFTVSIGVALFPDHAKSKKEIIHAADQAMYDAKKTARNRVSIALNLGGEEAV